MKQLILYGLAISASRKPARTRNGRRIDDQFITKILLGLRTWSLIPASELIKTVV